jgi:hypothetical protein
MVSKSNRDLTEEERIKLDAFKESQRTKYNQPSFLKRFIPLIITLAIIGLLNLLGII